MYVYVCIINEIFRERQNIMKISKISLLLVSTLMLTLASCSKSSSPISSSEDTTPTSIDTNTNTNTGTSEDTNTNTDTPDTSDTSGTDSSEDTSVVPEPETYSVTVIADSHIMYDFGGLDLTAILPETEVTFTVTADMGYLVSSVKLDDQILECAIDTYTFVMPNKNVVVTMTSEEIPVPNKYLVVGKNVEHVNFNLFDKIDFEEGETVQFTFSAKQGYAIKGFVITRDDTNAEITYAGTSFIEFEMPASHVSVTFDVAQTYEVLTNASAHTKITVSPDKTYYEAGTEVSVTVNVTDDKYQLDSVNVTTEKGETVSTKLDGETYKFTMPSSNVTISTVESEKPVEESKDPFTAKTTFQGKWGYYDGYYDYDMHFRIVFDGKGTLSWYLNYEDVGGDDWWTYDPLHSGPLANYTRVSSSPSDLPGTHKAGEVDVEYTYDAAKDQINYTAAVKMSTVSCTLQINRSGDNITSITMLNNMSGDFYQSQGCTLNKK